MADFCVKFINEKGKLKSRCFYGLGNKAEAVDKLLADKFTHVSSIEGVFTMSKVDIDEWHNAEIKNKSNAVGLDRRHEK